MRQFFLLILLMLFFYFTLLLVIYIFARGYVFLPYFYHRYKVAVAQNKPMELLLSHRTYTS